MRIFKYQVPLKDRFTIEMPLGANVLSFQNQNGFPCLLAAVWPNSSGEERRFALKGTGHEIDMDEVKQFIGTVQMNQGQLVWHLFEMK